MPCEHSHSCEGHSHTAAEANEGWDLNSEVDRGRCSVLNEAERGSLENVLKPWAKRLDPEPVLRSDADEQLLIYLPFYSAIKLKSISIIGTGGDENPKTMKVFLNIDQMDFSTAEGTAPTQEWELVADDGNGEVEYLTKFTKFQNVRSMWIFISENYGAETTCLQYIGLKGTATNHKRQAVTATYELKPQVADHKTQSTEYNPSIL